MNCEEVKAIIPGYINHTASEAQIDAIEEHLCVCNDCRQFLGHAIDKPHIPVKEKVETAQTEAPIATKKQGIGIWEYIVLGIGFAVLVFFIYLFFKG